MEYAVTFDLCVDVRMVYGFITYLMKYAFTFTSLCHGDFRGSPYAAMSLTHLIDLVTLTFDLLTLNMCDVLPSCQFWIS